MSSRTRNNGRAAVALCFLVALSSVADLRAEELAGPTTVFVVRHAEKEPGKDPALTGAGSDRAAELARMLRDAPIENVYSSQFRRTRDTAARVAAGAGKEVIVVPAAGDLTERAQALALRILGENRGASALVAGHSNTVPLLIEALGVSSAPRLTEQDYDDLFVVIVSADDRARLIHLHYGAVTP